jgi:uncharacterized phage protein (TIGR02218 family)
MAEYDFKQKQLPIAEIYHITLRGNTVMPLTSYNENVVVGGVTYQAVPIKRDTIQYQANLEVDRVTISMAIRGIMVGGQELDIPFIMRGNLFRNARVKISTIDPTQIGVVDPYLMWDGYVTGDISYNSGIFTIKCGSILDRLSDKFPKVLYTEFCQHRLYSQARAGANYTLCEVDQANWTHNNTVKVGAGSTRWEVFSDLFLYANFAEGYFDQGKFYIGSYSSSIRYHGDGYVLLLTALPASPADGASISACPGCDRTSATCRTKFNNLTHFFGFEFIPKPGMIS